MKSVRFPDGRPAVSAINVDAVIQSAFETVVEDLDVAYDAIATAARITKANDEKDRDTRKDRLENELWEAKAAMRIACKGFARTVALGGGDPEDLSTWSNLGELRAILTTVGGLGMIVTTEELEGICGNIDVFR